jgi:hypothetical protein
MTDIIDRSDVPISKTTGISHFFHVRMALGNVLYISYTLPASKIRNLVPALLPLATVGNHMAFVSIVILRSTRVRLNLLPFALFNYYQLNIRTYVIDPVSGKYAVYFLHSGVTSQFISLVTRLSGIPWQFINLATKVNVQDDVNSYSAYGNWNRSFSIRAQAFSSDSQNPACFENLDSAANFLIRPLVGFVGDKQRLGRFTIQHPEVYPETWILSELDFPFFWELGLVDEFDKPHSVFFVPTTDFSIYLPPTRVK